VGAVTRWRACLEPPPPPLMVTTWPRGDRADRTDPRPTFRQRGLSEGTTGGRSSDFDDVMVAAI
jgi:hypothetical protein